MMTVVDDIISSVEIFFFYQIHFETCFSQVQNANAVGESAKAVDASRTAKILNVVALVCGIIMLIIIIAVKASSTQ